MLGAKELATEVASPRRRGRKQNARHLAVRALRNTVDPLVACGDGFDRTLLQGWVSADSLATALTRIPFPVFGPAQTAPDTAGVLQAGGKPRIKSIGSTKYGVPKLDHSRTAVLVKILSTTPARGNHIKLYASQRQGFGEIRG